MNMQEKNKGTQHAKEDITRCGVDYAYRKLVMMSRCTGIDRDFRAGYEIVTIIEINNNPV